MATLNLHSWDFDDVRCKRSVLVLCQGQRVSCLTLTRHFLPVSILLEGARGQEISSLKFHTKWIRYGIPNGFPKVPECIAGTQSKCVPIMFLAAVLKLDGTQ